MFRSINPRAASVRARLPPNIFTASPLHMRFNAQRHMGTALIKQAVRIRRPSIKPKNVVIKLIVAYACYEIYCRIILSPLSRIEASNHIPEEELQEEPMFLPFPGTTKELPSVPYKGTDPEFQEFIKISKDRKLVDKIRVDLVEFIRDSTTRSLVSLTTVGNEFKCRRSWLDIDFPGPPPTFVRSGIEISDDAVSWVTQPVDASLVYKIRNVLWPTALFHSSWSFMKVLATEEFRNIAGKFGVQIQTSPAQQSMDQVLARSPKLMKELNGRQKVAGDVQRPLIAKDGPPQQPVGDKAKEFGDAAAPGKPNVEDDLFHTVHKTFRDNHASFAKPIMAARLKYRNITKELKPTQNLRPRGSVKISGLVELESDKAYLVFDVTAAWDPKTRDFDTNSMHITCRRLQRKKPVPVLPSRLS
ncbi:hypothetical protein SBOR_8565 [Sclerotinia borealis F-4128]|uniref:Uncharacterized protein n=1 Tax=Sclerotinia borealis (strain F-4128) TaxID=1432307 RepID=W9C590_SCLBF|nr:hypothetical protein SBOR_8565 [Sclerotinia borealis F-4128]